MHEVLDLQPDTPSRSGAIRQPNSSPAATDGSSIPAIICPCMAEVARNDECRLESIAEQHPANQIVEATGRRMGDNAAHYVTLGDECFVLTPQGKVDPVNRDGVVYKFHVTDFKNNRGKQLVSVFVTGSVETSPQRTDAACISAIRRAFDNGTLSFDQPSGEHNYKEIQLSASDLENQVTRSDAEIR